MNLSELTDKIYAEGVEKGNAKAAEIIREAEEKAAAMVAQAEEQANAIVTKAQQKAQDIDRNTRAELKLYAEQSVSAIRTEVTNLICGQVVHDSVKAATADGKFMQQIIAQLAQQLSQQGEVKLEAKDAKALQDYFAANAKGVLDKGVKISQVKDLNTDFSIQSAKGGYKLNFGDKEFEAYFQSFLRPQLVELLF